MAIDRWRSKALLGVCILWGLVSPIALILGVLLRVWADATEIEARDRWQAIWSFTALGGLAYGMLGWYWHPWKGLSQAWQALWRLHAWGPLFAVLVSCWLLNSLLSPVVTLAVGVLVRPISSSWFSAVVTRFLPAGFPSSPRAVSVSSGQDQHDDNDSGDLDTMTRANDIAESPGPALSVVPAARRALPLLVPIDADVALGIPLGGDLDWEQEGWFTPPEEALREHGVICGSSGSGKTSFALRLTSFVRAVYGWRVYYLDAKADADTAVSFVAEMARLGTSVRVFPNEPIDGWRGSSAVLRNRLLQLLTYSESFYRDGARLLIGLALDAPGGFPRSSAAFLQRLDPAVLTKLYEGTPRASQIKRLSPQHVDGTMLRYESFFTAAQTLLDGSWSWEDTQAAYLALDSLGTPDDTQAIGRFLIEDFGHFIKDRKPKEERVLLIVEEFSALAESVNVTNLFQRIRSAGGSVFVIAQGDAGLGRQADALLQACANLILFQGSDPDTLLHHAGTRLLPDLSHHRPAPPVTTVEHSETRSLVNDPAGRMSEQRARTGSTMRLREQPKIHPNTVRRLPVGEGFWIFKGQVQRMQIAQLTLSGTLLKATQELILPLQAPVAPAALVPPGVPEPDQALLSHSETPLPLTGPPLPPGKKKGRSLFDA